jgi:thymidylate kinase
MQNSSQLTFNIFEYLNSHANYAVLRNYKDLPLKNSSRDIDILLEKKEFLKIEKTIANYISAINFKIVTLFRSDKIVTYVCAKASNENVDIVQFDFFFNTSLFGILLLDVNEILNKREFNGAIYHVSKEYEFLDKYLQLKFLNKVYPQKYKSIFNEMTKSLLLSNILHESYGIANLIELEDIKNTRFKMAVLLNNLREKPLMQLRLIASFLWNYFKNLITYKGFSVGFSGPDGAGKTTVINSTIDELKKVYSAIELFHFRPNVISNLSEVAQKKGLKKEVDDDFSNPHRGGKTSKTSSIIRLLYYSIDYIIGYLIKVRPRLHKRSIVIFDRYFTDIIADSRRSRIFLKSNFLFLFGIFFIPKLNYNILLTADKDVILFRKQELTSDGIDNINEKLIYLSSKKGYYYVENNDTPEKAIKKILEHIFHEQDLKNKKRIAKW